MNVSTYHPFPSNVWICFALVNGHLESRTYMGCSKRKAIQAFKQDMKRGA